MNSSARELNYRTEAEGYWVSIVSSALMIFTVVWWYICAVRELPAPSTRLEMIYALLPYPPLVMVFLYFIARDWVLKSKRVEVRLAEDRAEVIETTCLGQRRIEVSADDAPELRLHKTSFNRGSMPTGASAITLSAHYPQPRKLKFGHGLYPGEVAEIYEALQKALRLDS